jgi:hypothetical protein
MLSRRFLPLAAALLLTVAMVSAQAPGHDVVNTYTLGGSGSWDYLAF